MDTFAKKMKLKITWKNHVEALEWIIINIILFLILYYVKFNMDKLFLYIYLIFIAILLFPILYLHTRYFLKNRGETIEIDDKKIIINKKGTVKHYLFSDIKIMFLHRSATFDKKSGFKLQLSPFESYSYLKLITNQNEKIIITCLMHNDLDDIIDQLEGIHFYKKRSPGFFKW